MSFINNLNIIQHHNNEIHKNLAELYHTIEERIKMLEEKEKDLCKREEELNNKIKDVQDFNKVSIIKSQDKKISHLERRLSQLSIKHDKLDKQNKKEKKTKKDKKTKKEKKNQQTVPKLEPPPIPVPPSPEVSETDSDEEFEVYVKKINKVKYYVSTNNEVYTILEDEGIGDCIGVLTKNKLVKHKTD